MLTAGEIAGMRGVIAQTLDSTALIQSGTITGDVGGGGTLTWITSGTVPCHLSPIRGNEALLADRISASADWILTLPAEADVDRDDQIVIDGTHYEVSAIRAPRTWELSRRVEVSEVV